MLASTKNDKDMYPSEGVPSTSYFQVLLWLSVSNEFSSDAFQPDTQLEKEDVPGTPSDVYISLSLLHGSILQI